MVTVFELSVKTQAFSLGCSSVHPAGCEAQPRPGPDPGSNGMSDREWLSPSLGAHMRGSLTAWA